MVRPTAYLAQGDQEEYAGHLDQKCQTKPRYSFTFILAVFNLHLALLLHAHPRVAHVVLVHVVALPVIMQGQGEAVEALPSGRLVVLKSVFRGALSRWRLRLLALHREWMIAFALSKVE